LKEYQNCEKDLEILQAKRNDIQKSLSKLKIKGTAAAARHQARLRQSELENELDLVESEIGNLCLKLRQ